MLSIATLLNDFMPLPRIEFGKIWSWLKVNDKPVRPEDRVNERRIIWIRERGENLPKGIAYPFSDGRVFYVPIAEASGKLLVRKAKEIVNPHEDLKSESSERIQPPEKIGELGSMAEPDVQRCLVEVYYGKKAPQILTELALV